MDTTVIGGNLATRLIEQGWSEVYGLARKPEARPGLTPVSADLQDPAALKQALAGVAPAHVFICTWLRQETEAENVRVNGAMVRNLFAALESKAMIHAVLVTGTKHYLRPIRPMSMCSAGAGCGRSWPLILAWSHKVRRLKRRHWNRG